ncbi:MAG: phytanoyl-CoA dioxygenase family protein [Planctomycetota bacterium]|nr:phytanoyl-CoA dioxygenase family protein [Planctomycetota bacterium]
MDNLQPFRASNDIADDSSALRARLALDGYLFFKGLGPMEKLLAARRDVTHLLADAGWIDRTDTMAAKWNGAGPYTEGEQPYMDVYRKIVHLPSFLAVPEDDAFKQLMIRIVDGEAMLHRLRIGRITFPSNTGQTTAAHQDFHYIRGTPETYTVWQPLGDCPIDLGPLTVLAGSHKQGFIEHREDKSKKYASMGLEEEQLPPAGSWLCNAFELGDFVLFHSQTIHKALPNITKDRLRLSTDNRYQRKGDVISPVSQGTHYNL